MARPRRIDKLLVQQAQLASTTATSVAALRRCQAVLLPALLGATLEQTAAALGVCRASVPNLQAAFRREQTPNEPLPKRGGRHHAHLTLDEEKGFLQPWLEPAGSGAVVVVAPLRAALSQQLGQPIKPSVIYRLLARHGWRKVAPDTRHPKRKPEVQEAWKKTPGSADNPADAGGRARPPCPLNVPGRSPLRAQGANAALLGTGAATARGGERLRARIHLCLRRGQSGGRPA